MKNFNKGIGFRLTCFLFGFVFMVIAPLHLGIMGVWPWFGLAITLLCTFLGGKIFDRYWSGFKPPQKTPVLFLAWCAGALVIIFALAFIIFGLMTDGKNLY